MITKITIIFLAFISNIALGIGAYQFSLENSNGKSGDPMTWTSEEFSSLVQDDSPEEAGNYIELDQTPPTSTITILNNTLIRRQTGFERTYVHLQVTRGSEHWSTRVSGLLKPKEMFTLDLAQEFNTLWNKDFGSLQQGDRISFHLGTYTEQGSIAPFTFQASTQTSSSPTHPHQNYQVEGRNIDGYFHTSGNDGGYLDWTFGDPFTIQSHSPEAPVSGQPLPGSLSVLAVGISCHAFWKRKQTS